MHRSMLRDESKQTPQPSTAGRTGRQPRHLQLDHCGVVAGQALVRGVHERLSTARPQDVFHCSSECSTYYMSHSTDEDCVKESCYFAATVATRAAVRPLRA